MNYQRPGVVARVCNTALRGSEAGRWQVQGQSGLHNIDILLLKKNIKAAY